MTIAEYRAALGRLDDAAFVAYKTRFGGDMPTREDYVSDFVSNPAHERRICYILELTTEEEKLGQATVESATAARLSAHSAKWSAFWAGIAVLISLAALAVATYGSR